MLVNIYKAVILSKSVKLLKKLKCLRHLAGPNIQLFKNAFAAMCESARVDTGHVADSPAENIVLQCHRSLVAGLLSDAARIRIPPIQTVVLEASPIVVHLQMQCGYGILYQRYVSSIANTTNMI